MPAKQLNNLVDEFTDFQMMSSAEMPPSEKVDKFWAKMGTVKVQGTCLLRFPTLSKLMKGLCCLPHSNADCERVFSKVRHIKTDFRKKMGNRTLQSLLAIKCHALADSECFQQAPPVRLLKLAKDATSLALGKKTGL